MSQHSYTHRDICLEVANNLDIPLEEVYKIVDPYLEELRDDLLSGSILELPNMGLLGIYKFKPTVEGRIKDINGVPYDNSHSDGYTLTVKWRKRNYPIINKSIFKFRLLKRLRDKLNTEMRRDSSFVYNFINK